MSPQKGQDFHHFTSEIAFGQGILVSMNYELSIGSFIAGVVIVIAGVVFVRFHQWIANNFGGGVGSYERYKLYALITCALGFVVMVNLHTMLLQWFFGMLFNR